MLIIQTDAAFEPRTKLASYAFVVKDFSTKKELVAKAELITALDNHEAEFIALTKALEYLIEANLQDNILDILTDSKGLALSLQKNYSKAYPARIAEIMQLLEQFNLYYTKLISDKENKHAHRLAISALHEKRGGLE